MKSIKNIRIVCAIIFFPIIMQLTGCSGNYINDNEAKTLDYTVIEETQIPEEFLYQIMEKKGESFELTYRDNEYLYIAKGYGNQGKTRTCVSVEKLYSKGTDIFVKFNITNKNKNLGETEVENTPFLVIKTEYRKGEVHFDEKDEY